MKKSFKQFSAVLLAAVMMATMLPAKAAPQKMDGNFLKISNSADLLNGEFTPNLVVDTTIGDGAFLLVEGAPTGEYISHEIELSAFEYMVASWNCSTPKDSFIEVSARAYVDKAGAWSDWLSWGKWGQGIKRGSKSPESELAKIDTDIFTIKGQNGETASKVQLKVNVTAAKTGESPIVRLLAITTKNTLEGQAVSVFAGGEQKAELAEKVKLDTPAYSQMIRERTIANVICSAATITTMLNDRGEDLLPEEIALNEYDYDYDGFGNWSFSVAAAGAMGYEAYARYGNLDLLRQELDAGYSVGIGVSYSNEPNGSYPYLEGAPMSTGGHLITITGYETVDGVEYFYSSDSAAGTDQAAFARYKAEELDKAWSGKMSYIVHEKELTPEAPLVSRVPAVLKAEEGKEGEYGLYLESGEKVEINNGFVAGKMRGVGGGIVAYVYKNGESTVTQEGAATTLANMTVKYNITGSKDGNLKISDTIIPEGEKGTEIEVYVMTNNGTTYVAPLTLGEVAVAAMGDGEGLNTGLIMAVFSALLILAGITIIVVDRRKKKKNR